MINLPELTFEEWVAVGIRNNYGGPPVCYSHDGLPCTPEEDDLWIQGEEPCISVIRVYENNIEARIIQENHSATQWRAVPYQ